MDKSYTPNLRRLIGDCESNYSRFMELLPELDDSEHWRFGVTANPAADSGAEESCKQVFIQVMERTKYTVTLAVDQESLLDKWVPKPLLTVRLYHDVKVAEVLSFQKNRYLRQNYPYPNDKMFHPDEKAQLNRFLGEWLDFCLRARPITVDA